MRLISWAIAATVVAAFPAHAQSADNAAGARTAGPAAGVPAHCTFDGLSAEERSRYQSRYRRRVRTDGQAFADQWLFEQTCMTAEQRKAAHQRTVTDKNGRPCNNVRLEMRVTPGFDGAMTMSPIPVCAD